MSLVSRFLLHNEFLQTVDFIANRRHFPVQFLAPLVPETVSRSRSFSASATLVKRRSRDLSRANVPLVCATQFFVPAAPGVLASAFERVKTYLALIDVREHRADEHERGPALVILQFLDHVIETVVQEVGGCPQRRINSCPGVRIPV